MQEGEEELEGRETQRLEKIAAMQSFVDAGLRSGIGTASRDELFSKAREMNAADDRAEASRSSQARSLHRHTERPADAEGQEYAGLEPQ
jgi:hypothetical protein